MKNQKLVIIGDSAFAEIAYEYFTCDSEYDVVAFAVESAFYTKDELFGKPVIHFDDIEKLFPPTHCSVYVAITYTGLNRVRTRLVQEVRAKGYALASYISSRAFVWRNVTIGEHCFIFEDNTIQPFVSLGDNVVIWSGNHIGHHSIIGNNCFISSHVVLSGFTSVGNNCFIGVNATISNNVTIHEDCWLGLGVTLHQDAPAGSFYKPQKFDPATKSTYDYFKIVRREGR